VLGVVLTSSAIFFPGRALALTVSQQSLVEMFQNNRFFFPMIEPPQSPAGDMALFDEPGISVVNSPGWFRALLKGVGVTAGGIAGGAGGFLVGGPVGAGVGAGALGTGAYTYFSELNAMGPGPGREWLISDTRIYDNINVNGVDVTSAVLASLSAHIYETAFVSSLDQINFIDPAFYPTRVLDENLDPITSIEGSGAFILTNTFPGGGTRSRLGSYVLNRVGVAGIPVLDNNDYLDIELGSILSVDNQPIIARSSLIVGYTEVPGPVPILGVGVAFSYSRKLRNRIKNKAARPSSTSS
jgi:hypothetical protein